MSLQVYEPNSGAGAGMSRHPRDPKRCACGVWSGGRGSFYSQCNGKALHDAVIDDKAVKVCTTHSPEKVAARAAASQARYDAETRKWARQSRRPTEYRDVLREIAAGHNDPRAVALAALEKWDDLPNPTLHP